MKFTFTRISQNRKTGPIPVTMTDSSSCPSACPFAPKKGELNGCYATYGRVRIHWSRLDEGKYGIKDEDLFREIRLLPKGQVWRKNVAGDLPHKKQKIDIKFLRNLVESNRGRKGFTYTHHEVLGKDAIAKDNRKAVEFANKNGFTINLSGNNPDHADKLKALKIGPVVSVIPSDSPNTFFTKGGNKVIVCPAIYRENVNCLSCQLCQKANRSVIVGFKAHGMGAKKVEQVAIV